MIDPLAALDRLAVDAQRELDELVDLVEAAKERRAIVFARANEQGRSSGDLARLLPAHILPHHVHPVVRVGRGLLAARRRRERTTS